MRKIDYYLVAVSVAASFPCTNLAAQATSRPDSVQHRNDCRLAGQVLTQGQPANKRPWALAYIELCGVQGGQVLATVLDQNRHTNSLPSYPEDVVMVTSAFHDAAVFRAALDIASDRTAGKVARIQALRVLFYQFSKGQVDPYESFLASDESTYVPLTDWGCSVGDPLPPDAAQRTLTVTDRIVESETDADLQAAARKAAGAARWRRAEC